MQNGPAPFKFKVKVRAPVADGAAVTAGGLGAAAGGGSLQPAAAPPSLHAAPSQGSLLPQHGVGPDPKKRKLPDGQDQPAAMHASQQAQPQRQQSDSLGAAPGAGTGMKVKLSFKKPSAAPSGISTAPAQDTTTPIFLAQPTLARLPNLRNSAQIPNQFHQPIAQPAAHASYAQQAQPVNQQRARDAIAGGPAFGAQAKAQQRTVNAEQKAQDKAQAKLDKDRQAAAKKHEKDAAQAQKLAAQDAQEQLQRVLGATFGGAGGNKLKIKIKSAGAGPPAPAAPAPAPQPGMVPLPSANGGIQGASSGQPARPVIRVKLKSSGSLIRAPSQADGMQPSHLAALHGAPASHPGPAVGAARPALPGVGRSPLPVHRTGFPQRGRGRGPGGGVPRPAAPKRPRNDDDDFDPSMEPESPTHRPPVKAPRIELTGAHLTLFMGKVLEGVAKKDDVQHNIFKAPVTDEMAPGYSSVVKNPMCFDVMRGKLSAGMYTKWELFEADMELVFSNAQAYNAPGTFVAHHASYLREVTKAYLKQAKQGNSNFRGVAAGITRKYQSEWLRTHKPQAAVPERVARPQLHARTASQVSIEAAEDLPLPPRELATRKPKPAGVAAAARERHSSLAANPNYGRGQRQHANVSYAVDEPGRDRPSRGAPRGPRGAGGARHAQMRMARNSDPDARKMAAVYVRRNETEELRETYQLAVPPGALPLAAWRGLAAGATAEGADYAAGNFAVRPMWPGALYPNLAAAVQAHAQGGAAFNGAGLPQDAYVRSVARFVRRCHPALRRILARDRLATCVAVEGAPEPQPAPPPAPPTVSTASAGAPGSTGSSLNPGAQQPATIPSAAPALPSPAVPNGMQQPAGSSGPMLPTAMAAQQLPAGAAPALPPMPNMANGTQQQAGGAIAFPSSVMQSLANQHGQRGMLPQPLSQGGALPQQMNQGGMPAAQQQQQQQQALLAQPGNTMQSVSPSPEVAAQTLMLLAAQAKQPLQHQPAQQQPPLHHHQQQQQQQQAPFQPQPQQAPFQPQQHQQHQQVPFQPQQHQQLPNQQQGHQQQQTPFQQQPHHQQNMPYQHLPQGFQQPHQQQQHQQQLQPQQPQQHHMQQQQVLQHQQPHHQPVLQHHPPVPQQQMPLHHQQLHQLAQHQQLPQHFQGQPLNLAQHQPSGPAQQLQPAVASHTQPSGHFTAPPVPHQHAPLPAAPSLVTQPTADMEEDGSPLPDLPPASPT